MLRAAGRARGTPAATRPGRRAFTSSASSGRVLRRGRRDPARPRGRPPAAAPRRAGARPRRVRQVDRDRRQTVRRAPWRWAAITSSPSSWSSAASRPPSSPPAPVTRTRSGPVSADHHGAAVDGQHLAVEVAREVGGQEGDRARRSPRACRRGRAGWAAGSPRPSGPSSASRLMSVSTQPGATQFTRRPWGASSAAERFRERDERALAWPSSGCSRPRRAGRRWRPPARSSPRPRADHAPRRVMHERVHRAEVGAQRLAPLLGGHRPRSARASRCRGSPRPRRAGRAPPRRGHEPPRLAALARRRRGSTTPLRPPAHEGDRLVGRRLVADVVDADLGPQAAEEHAHGAADAAACRR